MNPRDARTAAAFRAAAREVLEKRATLGALPDFSAEQQYSAFGGMVAFALGCGIVDDGQAAELLLAFSVSSAAQVRPQPYGPRMNRIKEAAARDA